MKILFLDDDPVRLRRAFAHYDRAGNVVYMATNVQQSKVLLDAFSPFDLVSLDHDLGGEQMVASGPGTGYEVAQAVAALPPEKRPTHVVIHSFNPEGARRMAALLADAGIPHERRPFNL